MALAKKNRPPIGSKLAWQLIHRDYCFQDTEHFNVLRLSPKAIPYLKG